MTAARAHRLASVAAWLVLLAAPAPLAAQSGGAALATVVAAWVELTPDGAAVRAVTTAATCPRAAVVAAPEQRPTPRGVPMRVRALPAPPAFPNLTCEWQPPAAARWARVAGWPAALRLPAPNPRRLVVLGDSGCLGGDAQDCVRDWPFADIARLAAARQPDLVIHVGDYNYRGTNCVAYDACCTYNPDTCAFPDCGDAWTTWRDDFFTPAAPLLAAAPWVMVRGNHELCSRAGKGWFRYLDPRSPPGACAANPVEQPTFTAPYALDLGAALRLLVIDSANACGEFSIGDQIATYRDQFARLAQLAAAGRATRTWLVSHKSPWSVLRDVAGSQVVLNHTLQQASANRLPAAVSLVLAGHEHLFQSLAFADTSHPPVLVVGTGGGELDDPTQVPTQVENLRVGSDGPTIAAATTVHDHGYLYLELGDEGWTGTFHDRFDQPLARCASSGHPAPCAPAAP
ncbi:metallophosphoesterase [bacterium]|nr:metallophosphoesterase [bacterium]